MKKKILVLCTGNSCRSQMAEGYLKHFAGEDAEVYSAGIEAHGLNPSAVHTMKEDGIDISAQTSNTIQQYIGMPFDYLITVCDHAQEHCPVFPGSVTRIHHSFSDPAKATGSEEYVQNQFRQVRNAIKDFCRQFISEYVHTDPHK